jgi:NDP-sugar pyrophosphorylase family protein
MVMAAGAGTRLRPLTNSVPKPMVPIVNRPVLEYTIENLRRHGITEIMLNLHSHPDQIRDHFRDGARWGVQIHYSHERRLLGTAGGVKKVASFLSGGTFLVMSGDGLSDVDLDRLVDLHRRKNAQATIGLKPVDSRFEYGIALMDGGGRVKRFVEKPRWRDIFSNDVNTGIYILEPAVLSEIPDNRIYDFGNDLWPKLLKKKARIFGQVIDRYWCDVGNIAEYRRAQKDLLDGNILFPKPPRPAPRRGVKFEPRCAVGKNAEIGAGSVIGPYTVIGDNARIGRGSALRNCILWDNVRIGDHVTLDTCILGHGSRVADNASICEGVFTVQPH